MVNITPIINGTIEVAGTALVAVITAHVIPWLKSKMTAAQWTAVKAWIQSGVKAAETLIPGPGTGKKKFQYVLDSIKTACSTHHITYDETAVKNEIQAVWNDLYNSSNPAATQVTETAKTDATAKAATETAVKSAVEAVQKAVSDTASKVTASTDNTAKAASQSGTDDKVTVYADKTAAKA